MNRQSKKEIVDKLRANTTMTKEQYDLFKKLCDEFDLLMVPEVENCKAHQS